MTLGQKATDYRILGRLLGQPLDVHFKSKSSHAVETSDDLLCLAWRHLRKAANGSLATDFTGAHASSFIVI